jgi:hypothetical protein
VIERVGIDRGALADASTRVPFGLVGKLMEECVVASACHLFRHAESVLRHEEAVFFRAPIQRREPACWRLPRNLLPRNRRPSPN